jgi:uncharacterized SAM-binding protein YcdF (DUF218 family)
LPLFWLVFLPWCSGLALFAYLATTIPSGDDYITDAIVVLTGGSGRLNTGLELLVRDQAAKLFISGVSQSVDLDNLLCLSRHTINLDCCVALGYAADDTRGNAIETAAWMQNEGYHSLRLVTANYHMVRSLFEFRQAMPMAEIIPHPVVPDSVHLSEWWHWPGTAGLIVLEYNKYLLAQLRSLALFLALLNTP